MKIEVRLFAYFREGRDKKVFLEINEEEVTLRYILNKLNIDEKEVSILLINGRDGKGTTSLKDGDVVALFPPVGGG